MFTIYSSHRFCRPCSERKHYCLITWLHPLCSEGLTPLHICIGFSYFGNKTTQSCAIIYYYCIKNQLSRFQKGRSNYIKIYVSQTDRIEYGRQGISNSCVVDFSSNTIVDRHLKNKTCENFWSKFIKESCMKNRNYLLSVMS